MQPEIRSIAPNDAAALRELFIFSLRCNPDGFIQDETRYGDIAERAETYKANHGDMLVLLDGTRLAGFGALKRNDRKSGRVELCNLHLHQDYHGRGFGKLMVTELIERARNLGYQIVELHVTVTQKPAIALYKRIGFVQVDRQLFVNTDGSSYDTIYMDLVL